MHRQDLVLPDDDCERRISEAGNGDVSELDGAELDRQLQQSSTARRAYLTYRLIESELRFRFAGRGAAAPSLQPIAVDAAEADPRRRTAWNALSHGARWWALAASLLLTLAAGWMLGRLSPIDRLVVQNDVRPGSQLPEQSPRSLSIARISATRNCRWEPGAPAVAFGERLLRGQRIALAEGFAEVTFHSGARVVLEGPAEMTLSDEREALLQHGRLAASVPQNAQGLNLRTPLILVANCHADFGLASDAAGEAEVHVFRGQLRAQLNDAAGESIDTVELGADEAARVRPASASIVLCQAKQDQFVRSLVPGSASHLGLYAYEGFDYPPGPLAAQNGGFGWAGSWDDIETGDQPGEWTNRVEFGNIAAAELQSTGNHALQIGQRNRARRVLSTSIGGVFDAAGLVENQDGVRLVGKDRTVLYVSFVQQVSRTDDGFYGLELHRGDGNGNRVLCIGNGAEKCGYGVTSNFNGYGETNYPRLGAENTAANFFVVRVEFGDANQDRVVVYRNPRSLLNEMECEVDAELIGNFAFDRIGLGNFDGSKHHAVDELRIGTLFVAATGKRDAAGEPVEYGITWMDGGRRSTLAGRAAALLVAQQSWPAAR